MLIVTDAQNGGGVRQWVYQDCTVALDLKWQEDGIRHMKIGESELVLSKLGPLQQILIDGVEQYQTQTRWNIIVYDKILGNVAANLVFDD